MTYRIVSPSNVDSQSPSDSWEEERGANFEFETIEAAREAIDVLQTQQDWGTLAIQEEGSRFPVEIYKRTCIYCDAEVNDHTHVPTGDEDDSWELAAAEHEAGCEWIITRAHTLAVKVGHD